ncbi:MAG: rhomboid family intramembrane serine protease [Planctomycetaceae bacterium]|nr:rhomboid family intramembrane serine protease [Planctomycetaceae bacterium]
MFIPLGTDAPLYHRPIATIGLIVANVLLYAASFGGQLNGWQLQLGQGLHPVQWWTSAFFHYDVVHLLGNMIFLWTFGLIVEGKLGWWRFLPLYLALAGVDGAITQAVMLAAPGPAGSAGGASGVIYALMAVALIWAPRNDVDVFYFFGFGLWLRTGVFQASILAFSLCYIGLNLVLAAITGFRISTAVLHLLGAAVGFPVACLMLRLKLVDCEGWDAFTLWRGRKLVEEIAGPSVLREARSDPDAAVLRPQQMSIDRRVQQLKEGIAARNPLPAWSAYQDIRDRERLDTIDQPTYRRLIDGLRIGKDWGGLLVVLEDYVARFPEDADRARVLLADLLVRREQRPQAALRVLEPLRDAALGDDERRLSRKLRSLARTQIAEGVIELAKPPTGQ